jgi:hypothetical protein
MICSYSQPPKRFQTKETSVLEEIRTGKLKPGDLDKSKARQLLSELEQNGERYPAGSKRDNPLSLSVSALPREFREKVFKKLKLEVPSFTNAETNGKHVYDEEPVGVVDLRRHLKRIQAK